jgi:quercetin dioxygenase-like cupin family protein
MTMDPSLPTIHDLRAPVELPDDGILSRAIYDDEVVRVVHFSFAAGQRLSDHTASLPVLLEIVDGEATITLGDEVVDGRAGTWVHLPADLPHSVVARTPVTMLLTLLKRGS